ncbi:DUF1433 domain-containing protein [Listeria sp. ILCC797]|uniref:DUF1433 domain-containing protein n=1 Tax=Listeria sp. ILCC797 TaxID=1918333 RepID=UPI000B58847C|nr:DUF1433 domain-containing protein [Listeria sp. ILCC797]
MNKIQFITSLLILSILISACGKDNGSMSDQQKAEKFADQMKPKIEQRIYAEDYNDFVTSIQFEETKIDPLGGIQVEGYVNQNPDYYFVMDLTYNDTSVPDSFTFSDALSKKTGNFDREKVAPLPSNESTSDEKHPGTSLKSI